MPQSTQNELLNSTGSGNPVTDGSMDVTTTMSEPASTSGSSSFYTVYSTTGKDSSLEATTIQNGTTFPAFVTAANDSVTCATSIQTMDQLISTATPLTLSLIVVGGVCTLLTWCLYAYGCFLIIRNIKLWHGKGNHMIVISMYPVMSTLSFFGLLFPVSSVLCQAMDAAYLSVVLWKMASSIIAGMGGKDGLVEKATGTTVSLRSPPCCCCCFCLPTKEVSRKFISGVMALMLQCLFVRPTLMAVAAILYANGTYDTALNPDGAFLWVTLFNTMSFLFAMYGLSLLMSATKIHMTTTMISGRYLALIFALLGSGVAGIVFNILTAAGVISCTVDAPAKQIAAGRFHFTTNLIVLVACISAVTIYHKATRNGTEPMQQRLLTSTHLEAAQEAELKEKGAKDAWK